MKSATTIIILSSLLLMGTMPIEKDFESSLDALTMHKESLGVDATSSEHHFCWTDGDKIRKYRYLVTDIFDSVRILEDIYFDDEGKLTLYTYWSGVRKDLKLLVQGRGPHFLAKGKCVFGNGRMTEWYEKGNLRTNVPKDEWREMEKYILHTLKGAKEWCKDIVQSKKLKR